MAELTKQQLEAANASLFPNNNTGFITADKLRTFNDDMIVSLVDEIQYNADSASFSNRINVLDPSGSAQAITSLQIATASLNAYTASQNSFNSSATASIVALQNFSSSLDTTYATDAQLSASASTLQNNINTKLNTSSFNAYTASFTVTGFVTTSSFNTYTQSAASGVSASINAATQSLSASVAAINATQLSTASFNTYTASAATNVSGAINTATQSLSSSVATTTSNLSSSIGSLSASVAVTTGTQLSTASFNIYTQSANLSFSQLRNSVSQSATTGSNTFIGNQIVSGNVNIAGNITALSASFTYLTTIYETASVIYSSGSNQLGDELSDVQTLSGSVRVQGALLVNGVPVQTSSFDASGYLLTSSFNTYTASASTNVSGAINTATQSLSSSIAVTTNGLDLEVNGKLDSSSFNTYTQSNDIKVNALIAQTGSYAISSSVASALNELSSSISLTYATETELSASASTLQNGINSKVETSTFNTYTSSQSAINTGLTQAIATRLTTASFNSYTSSNDGKVNSLIAATGSYITSAQTGSMTVLSSSFAQTASFALNVTPTDVTPFLSKSIFDAYTGSAALGVSESINSATQSLSSSIAVTTNNLDLEVNGKLDSSSFNTYTQSNDSKVNSLISATGSYITSAQTSSMSVLSSSFAVTASFAQNVTPTDVSMFVSQSTFNAYTQSNNSVVNALVSATSSYAISSSVAAIDASQDGKISSLTAQTSSYVTESETGSFARVNTTNVFTQNQTISGNLDVTGKITALSASITYLETIYETASVIYSSGSNQFGDELSDVQTLSGSVKVQGGLTVNGTDVLLVGQTASYASASISSSYALLATSASVIYVQNTSANQPHKVTFVDASNTTGQLQADNDFTYNPNTNLLTTTASFAITASYALNVTPTDVSMFVSQSTFNTYTSSINSYTASNDSKVNSLIAATASYVTSAQTSSMSVLSSSYAVTASFALNATVINTGSFATTGSNTFIGNQIISGNLLVTGSNINLEVDPPALGGVGITNIKTVLDTTASAIVTSLDITRLGAGPTGDSTGIRLQTFSGSSDTTGDRVLSRITTAVNRHTTLGLSGSVVNTQIVGTWGTGSTAFTSQIITTAQSGSATLTLNAGNPASNNAGGTASIAAGLIRIGTNAAHTISVTGSVGPISVVGALTASVISASTYIGIPTINTASFATIQSNRFVGNQTITGSLNVSSSDTGDNGNFINGGVTIVGNNNGNAISVASGSVSINSPQGTGFFYSNLPITSSGLRINGTALVNDLIVSGVFGGNSSLQVAGNASVSESLNVSGTLIVGNKLQLSTISSSNGLSITGSVRGTQTAGEITGGGTTASFDCSTGNFFTLVLSGGTNHLSASNIRPGQTISVRVTTQSGNAVTCSSAIKQPSGSLYTPTNAAGTDILTFISYDSTLYMVSAKNFI